MNVMGLKFEYDSFTLFSINDYMFFKLTLFFLIIRAEATLIYKAVIVRNLINQPAPMIIRKMEAM